MQAVGIMYVWLDKATQLMSNESAEGMNISVGRASLSNLSNLKSIILG